ncbi:unnamed protein product [Kuraishia capsulata CBS 1993]|uniref:Uncharacterized protein n=1 Tax=Kuraishia capsulata CBS 1993 TaxID=1382522 RepID=W6MK81_9ASCO|nr:uncharacterized protein KUCA_T00002725001 [Kuraishia capsulata CBS 1993]CDK26751.1 unnamed protein product [Kuraishia capsulata CBS 1993]
MKLKIATSDPDLLRGMRAILTLLLLFDFY